MMFSYVLLCDFYPVSQSQNEDTSQNISISWIEVIVILWVFTLMTEEVHQVYSLFLENHKYTILKF